MSKSSEGPCGHRWLVATYLREEVIEHQRKAIPDEIIGLDSCQRFDDWMEEFVQHQESLPNPTHLVEIARTRVSHFEKWNKD